MATFKGILIFTLIFLVLVGLYPYFPFRINAIIIFRVTFTLIAICIFIILISKKGSLIYNLVLISSFILIVGNILSIVFNQATYFLNTVLLEAIIFMGIVSYNNKLNSQKSITNELLYEQELLEKKSLLELNKTKSNFFANISHEFRTPLTLINNSIDTTLNEEELPQYKRKQFEMAKRNSDRLLGLVDQLLDLSKIDAGQLKLKIGKGNILQLISALSESFRYSANLKQIDFHIKIKQTSETSYFDKQAIEKIVLNLLSNAIKYTPQNKEVYLEADINNDQLNLKVKNTGIGLTEVQKQSIFQRFYQTSEDNIGSGIGLALVYELVELNKGSIKVQSEVDSYTLFEILLPVSKSAFSSSEIVEKPLSKEVISVPSPVDSYIDEELISEKLTDDHDQPILLIVEDNADLRSVLYQQFKNQYTILMAENGQLGEDLALEHIPDIIISDVMMPVKDGIALTNTLKNDERTSHIPILLLTAKAGEENEIKGIKTGADDYITKPFSSKILTHKVAQLIESRLLLQKRYSQELVLVPNDVAITDVDTKFLEKVQHILDQNLVEASFSASEFSKAVGMSRMQLHRKLKALTGLSASEFIRSQRLKLATQLLKTSNTNVSQVGYAVGFNDHSYFTKCFKAAYNCTPSEYAKRN